jgi:WD40 repeat protein
MRKTFLPYIVKSLFTIILVSSCTQSPTALSQTVTPTSTLTPSITPIPSLTPTSTFIPITPAFSGTQAPKPENVISTENTDRLTLFARWGNGNTSRAQYTPDGKYLIAACSTGIYFYNSQNYSLVKYIDLGTAISDIAITQDGLKMAAASFDKVFIFNQGENEPIITIDEMVSSLAFSPNGQILALGTYSRANGHYEFGHIKLWNPVTGNMILEFENDDDWINSIAFSPSGKFLATAGYATKMWGLDGKLLDTHGNYVSGGNTDSLSFSPDGTLLAEGADTENILHVWRVLKNGRLVIFRVIALQGYPLVSEVAISPDGKWLAAGTSSGLFVWQLSTGALIHQLNDSYTKYGSVAWMPDSKNLVTASSQRGIEIWNRENGELLQTLNNLSGAVIALTWLPNGKTIATATDNGVISLIELRSGNILKTFNSDSLQNRFAVSPDGNLLAIKSYFSGESHGVVIYNLKDSTFRHVLKDSYGAGLTSESFSRDGKYLVTSGPDALRRVIQVWNTKDWSLYNTWTIDNNLSFSTLAFCPDGQTVALYLSRDSSIKFYGITDGLLIRTIETAPNAITFAPDGQLFLSMSEKMADNGDSSVQILNMWNVGNGSSVYKLDNLSSHKAIPPSPPYYHDLPNTIAWSPNGELFAIGFADGTVGILRASDGKLLQTLAGHTMRVMGVAFSPDGQILASASLDGTIRLWGIK